MNRNLPLIVGIAGTAGSGKDTLAAALCDTFGYTRRGLADPIKELLNARFGWKPEQWQDRVWKEAPAVCCVDSVSINNNDVSYRDPFLQWERHSPYLSPRELAQWLGTEVGRDTFGDDAWINALFNWWNKQKRPLLVVPDLRFDNEAQAIRNRGGVVLRVIRPGVAAVAQHVSEQGISNNLIDLNILNDRDITSFLNEALSAFAQQLPY